MDDPLEQLISRIVALEDELEALRTKEGTSFSYIDSAVAGAGGVVSFDFQNIPDVYSKIVIDLYARGDTAATSVRIDQTFNADGSAIYDSVRTSIKHSAVLATAEGLAGTALALQTVAAANSPAGAFDFCHIEIPAYANTGGHKVVLVSGTWKAANTTGNIYAMSAAGWYRSPNAISRVTLTPAAGNFAQYSTARLYGVL